MTSQTLSKKAALISELEQAITEWETLESTPQPICGEVVAARPRHFAPPPAPTELIMKLKEQLEAFD